jgi:ubiquinone/menaquinone biosynthesis C-methylase UbiE
MSETPSTENAQPPGSQPSPRADAASVSADVGNAPQKVLPRPNPSVPAPPRPSRNPPGSLPPRSSSTPPSRLSARGTTPPPLSQSSFDMPPSTIDGMAPATEDRPSTGPLRRRSRRVVKTEDDAVTDQQLSETPPPVGQVAPVLDGFSSQTPPPLFAVSKSPPPPPFEIAVAAPPVEFAPEPPPLPLMDPSEMMEVIQPMRILAIGDDLPPVSVQQPIEPTAPSAISKADAPAAPIKPRAKFVDEIPEDGWTPAPPQVVAISTALASETAQANAAQVVAKAAKETALSSLPPHVSTTQNETIATTADEARFSPVDDFAEVHADVEIEPSSKEGANLRSPDAAIADEIEPLEEIEVEAHPPAASAQPTPTPSATAAPKKPPPPLPPKAPPPIKTAPPPPPAAAPAQTTQKPAALPEPSRRRQRPWWEDVFDDDFIRTMDRPESKAIHREVNFIEQCLGLEKGASILDLACGTGRHAVELSSRGYAVVGYDLSLNMLALAADEAQDRNQKLNFLQGDMREMAFDQVFDGVYSWSTSFGYFDDEKNFDVLVRMQRALRTGGILVLDIINRDYIAPRQPSMVWFEGDGCVCMDEMQVDFFSSRLKVKRTAMFDDGRSREIDYSMRLYNLHEIGKMMHDADFKVLEVTGHPAHPGVFFGSESPRLIIVAERKS